MRVVLFCFFTFSSSGIDPMAVLVAELYSGHWQQKLHQKPYIFISGKKARKNVITGEDCQCNAHFFFSYFAHGQPEGSPHNRTIQEQWGQLELRETPSFWPQKSGRSVPVVWRVCMCVCWGGGLSGIFSLSFLVLFCPEGGHSHTKLTICWQHKQLKFWVRSHLAGQRSGGKVYWDLGRWAQSWSWRRYESQTAYIWEKSKETQQKHWDITYNKISN